MTVKPCPHFVFVRSPYNYDHMKASIQSGLVCESLSLTQQQFKDDADINTILKRFNVTGVLMAPSRQPQFGDFTGPNDYKEALDLIHEADRSFYELPAALRDRFKNDPVEFLDFISDDNNRSEAIELGLIPPPAAPTGAVPTPSEEVSLPPSTGGQTT